MAERGRLGFQTARKGGGGGPPQVVLHIARLPPPARVEGPRAMFKGPRLRASSLNCGQAGRGDGCSQQRAPAGRQTHSCIHRL